MPFEARKDRLLVQDVGDELVVYDERSHRAHRLNGTARTVWRLADGRRSLDELARLLRDQLDGPGGKLDVAQSEALVRLSLEELARADLLVDRPSFLIGSGPTSRRRILTTAASVLVPVVASIVAPTAADAQSGPTAPPTPTRTLDSFNGTYTGSGRLRPQATPGTCIDENFPEMVNMRGVLSLNTGAQNPWIKTHLPSTEFAFSNPQATLQSNDRLMLTAAGTFQPDNFFTYTAIESYTITGSTLTGTQTFTLSVCTWVYDVTMTRQ